MNHVNARDMNKRLGIRSMGVANLTRVGCADALQALLDFKLRSKRMQTKPREAPKLNASGSATRRQHRAISQGLRQGNGRHCRQHDTPAETADAADTSAAQRASPDSERWVGGWVGAVRVWVCLCTCR